MDAKQHTFLFADLVGFTSFTERAGDDAAADVAVAFQSATARLASDYGCEVVKSFGDAVMIHGRDPARVVALALRVARGHAAGEGRGPAARVGVHSGTAVRRGSDWYGSTVNVAARLAEAAAPGEVLISLTTRDELAALGPVTIADRGRRSFKNVGSPVGVFAAAAPAFAVAA
jgi:adenylate cyclase